MKKMRDSLDWEVWFFRMDKIENMYLLRIPPPLTEFIFEIGALKIDLEKNVDTFTRLDVSLLYLSVELFSNS